MVDTDGAFFRAELDPRDSCTLNISDKRVALPNLGPLYSILLLGRKILASSSNGKLHLIKTEARGVALSLLQSYDIEQLLRTCTDTKLKGAFYMTTPKLIHANDKVCSIGCILRRVGGENRRKGGVPAILRITGAAHDLDLLLLSE